jgi:uncharacterized protein (TIGR00297 family)
MLTNEFPINSLLIGFLIAFVIVILSYKVKFLTLSGSIATFFLAGTIFSLGGIKWSVPILTFFITSSILSKVRKKHNAEVELFFEKNGVRDYFQVFANGGIGGVLVVLNFFYPSEVYYLMYLSSLSAVCADTWATEIGTWRRTNTYNVLNLRPIEQGISGGISLIGTTGAFLGTFAICFSGLFWSTLPTTQYFFLIILSGIFGSFFDSFLGATVQSQNKCSVCNKITEREIHCNKKSDYHSGMKWINNDMVNLLSGFSGSTILIIIIKILN